MTRLACVMLLCVVAAGLAGCSTYADLQLEPVEGEVGQVLAGGFDTVVYAAHDHQTVNVLMLAGPPESPQRAMLVRMFWRSRAGRTPFDSSATNAVVRYIEFNESGAVVFGGGGLVRPRSTAGAKRYTMTVQDARLALLDATEGAVDPDTTPKLTVVTGGFTAKLDEARLGELHRQLQVRLNDQLGYPRLVGFDDIEDES